MLIIQYKAGTSIPASGSVVITGTETEGETLTADTSGVTDPDGIQGITYQWKRDGGIIPGATSSTYLLDGDDVGTVITVAIVVTDNFNNTTNLTSAGTSLISAATVGWNLANLNEGTFISGPALPNFIHLQPDGSRFLAANISGGDGLREYSMSTNYDLSTVNGTPSASLGVFFQVYAITVNPAGTRGWTSQFNDKDNIRQFDMTTPFDITTATNWDLFRCYIDGNAPADASIEDLFFSNDGTKLYLLHANTIQQYTVPTPFSISFADGFPQYQQSYTFSELAFGITAWSAVMSTDGSTLFVHGRNLANEQDALLQYDFGTAFDVSTLTYSGVEKNTGVNQGRLAASPDGTKIYVASGVTSRQFNI